MPRCARCEARSVSYRIAGIFRWYANLILHACMHAAKRRYIFQLNPQKPSKGISSKMYTLEIHPLYGNTLLSTCQHFLGYLRFVQCFCLDHMIEIILSNGNSFFATNLYFLYGSLS